MKKKGVAVLYLSVGSGHQVAAESISNYIKISEPDIPIIVEDPFANVLEVLPSVFNALQTFSSVLAPNIYDLAWRRKVNYDTYQWVEDINLLQDYLIDRFSKKSVDKIISTHVLPSILGVGLKKKSIIKEVYSVITDFGTHSFWPISGIDKYFVSNEDLKNTLVYRGIENSKIRVTGIPIRHDFFLRDFIKPVGKRIKILIIVGAIRGGGYIHIRQYIKDIIESMEEKHKNVEVTIVTGSQKEIKKELRKLCNGLKLQVKILGFVENMIGLMAIHDILITKPGGLIISEALAVGSCLILLKPGPGQEIANAEFLARNGLAFNGENSEQAMVSLNYLIDTPQVITNFKSKTKKFGFINSSKEIYETIFRESIIS